MTAPDYATTDAEVGRYLREHLADCYALVAMREHFGPPSGVYVMDRVLGWEHPDGKAAAVAAFVGASSFGPCINCFTPVVLFPDGRLFDWPRFSAHLNCGGVAQPVERRPFKSQDGGSRPSAATTKAKVLARI